MIKERLRKIEIFEKLSDSEISKIINISIVKKLSRENVLFYEGEMPQYFYVLLKGHVKLYKTDLKGNEIVIHYFTTPSLVAEMPSFENIPFPATSMAMRDETEVLLIDRERFVHLLHSDPKFSFSIIRSLTRKMKNLEQVINRNLIYDAMTKVCAFIKENPDGMLNTKHKEIATILNMAPETFSRVLKKLKSLNILDAQCNLIDQEKLDMFLAF